MKRRIEVVTGTRHDDRAGEAARYLDSIHEELFCVIVGDCPTGIDAEVVAWCRKNGVDFLVAPALWEWFRLSKRKSAAPAGPRRNGFMALIAKSLALGLSPEAFVHGAAFPFGESRGTRNCVDWFEKVEIEHEVF
jgi:hypothetical protein